MLSKHLLTTEKAFPRHAASFPTGSLMITKIRGVGGEARREAEQGWGHQRSSCPCSCCRSSLHKRCLGYSEPHLSQSLSLSGRPAVKTEPERFFCGAWFFFLGGGDVLSVAAIYLNQKFRRKEVCIKITFSSSKFCEYEMRNIPKYSDNTRLARATGLPWSTLET